MLKHLARLSSWARAGLAGILARAIDASQVQRAFRISLARDLPIWACQFSSWCDDKLVFAGARALVVTSDAFLVGVADGGVAAGGVALAAVAVEAGIAVLVSSAFFTGRGLLYDRACAAEWI